MDNYSVLVKDLDLSTRSERTLLRNHIETVPDLLALSEDDLYQMRNLGVKSVNEILSKINELKEGRYHEHNKADISTCDKPPAFDDPEEIEEWLKDEEHQSLYLKYLSEHEIRIGALETLPTKEYNLLLFSGNDLLEKVIFQSAEKLAEILGIEQDNATVIVKHIRWFVRENRKAFSTWLDHSSALQNGSNFFDVLDTNMTSEHRKKVLEYVLANDVPLNSIGFSTRTANAIRQAKMEKMSDIILLDKAALSKVPALGNKSINEIRDVIRVYLKKHESKIIAYLNGDLDSLWDDNLIQERILNLFTGLGFKGLSFSDMKEHLDLPEAVAETRLKKNIGMLIAAGELEYVDYRCHRVYKTFEECLATCPTLTEREQVYIQKSLLGATLQAIGTEDDVTKEGVRQVVKKGLKKLRRHNQSYYNRSLFDEDYYQHLYKTYSFNRAEASQWLGIPSYVWKFLSLNNSKQGNRDLSEALHDNDIDIGLRLKIKNYLNKDRVFIDGKWVDKRRTDLENAAIKALCQDSLSFSEFSQEFNQFLEALDIPYDENLYYTDQVMRSRKNRLAESTTLLWKRSEMMRYYDIEGQDYAELLDTLNLESYENIDLSTQKFMEDYPEVMHRYDIRDQYELHNLLRKILPEGSYHDLHFGKMPVIKFGEFDRDSAIFDLMIEHAPISSQALADIIHQEYGYDPATVMGSYFGVIAPYYEHGMYNIDQKVMREENRQLLSKQLSDDFYYIDELRKLYKHVAPDADLEEINPLNMTEIGFTFRSNYVIRNSLSTEAYIESLLTKDDIVNLKGIKQRFASLQSFYSKLAGMKETLDIIEFEPDVIINFSKLERSGITKEMLREFCEEVVEFVQNDASFSVQSLKQNGFRASLFELGFSDWFYSNLLIADDRLRYGRIFGNLIFSKGEEQITRRSLIVERICAAGSIDRLDLIDELTTDFGCTLHETDQAKLTFIIKDSEVVYDPYLDRYYQNEELYHRELDEEDF